MERTRSQVEVTEQDPQHCCTEDSKATKLQLLWFWPDYLLFIAVQPLVKIKHGSFHHGMDGARSCSLSSSFKVQLHYTPEVVPHYHEGGRLPYSTHS